MKRSNLIVMVLFSFYTTTSVKSERLMGWEYTEKNMADFVIDGYELKSRSDNSLLAVGSGEEWVEILFYLQKGTTLIECRAQAPTKKIILDRNKYDFKDPTKKLDKENELDRTFCYKLMQLQ